MEAKTFFKSAYKTNELSQLHMILWKMIIIAIHLFRASVIMATVIETNEIMISVIMENVIMENGKC